MMQLICLVEPKTFSSINRGWKREGKKRVKLMIFCKVDIFFKTEINILKCITACKYQIIDLYFYIKLIKTTNPNPTAKRTLWGYKRDGDKNFYHSFLTILAVLKISFHVIFTEQFSNISKILNLKI